MIGTKLLLLVFLALGIVFTNCAEEDYFTAAVFETTYFHDDDAQTKEDVVLPNLYAYMKAAETAASKGVDLMVFSEYGLFPYYKNRTKLTDFSEHVPDPQVVKTNPCNEENKYKDRLILLQLSCMAKKYRMYVVANMGDKQPCDETDADQCPENGKRIYNTDVAFDREGNLVARYHKNHLYFELMNTPRPYEMVTFDTDFGKMGLIVCFDSVWKGAVDLVEKHGIDTMIFPTHWFDDIVPLNAIEWQQSWALGNKVNFIASNVHHPGTGSLGSGIYSKKFGAVTYTYNPDGKARLLIGRLPRGDANPSPKDSSRFVVTKDEVYEERGEDGEAFPEVCHVSHFISMDELLAASKVDNSYKCLKEQFAFYGLVKLTDARGSVTSCNGGTCCTVIYSAEKMDEDYFVAVFNGTNDVRGYFKWAEENCFLVRCDPDGGRPCAAVPSKANTVFDYVEIRATFTETAVVYPTISKQNHRLAPKSEFEIEKKGKETILKFKSKCDKPLLKVGMMARVYERDPPFVPFFKLY